MSDSWAVRAPAATIAAEAARLVHDAVRARSTVSQLR
jgi:hypothetical protein